MAEFSSNRARKFYAETYDTVVPDWPGELDFYLELARDAASAGRAVLEIACGTGRVAVRLAQEGINVVGLDSSPEMLSVAREKIADMDNFRLVHDDMRSFDLGEKFGLVIIPGHSFQNILTPEDQVSTLGSIKRHLAPDGTLVVHLDHQNLGWLGEISADQAGVYNDAGSFKHPKTGQQIRTSQSWHYEPATQRAVSQVLWEAVDENGVVNETWQSGSLQFHCMFRYEMQHLLERTGFAVDALYGDFFRNDLQDDSSEMIWVAKVNRVDQVTTTSAPPTASTK